MADQPRNKGPWTHRLLVWVFGIALGLLLYWLLGFIVGDIATWPGPDYQTLEEEMLDPKLLSEERRVSEQIKDTQRLIDEHQRRQGLLRDSTNSSGQTMNQLLDINRLSLEKNVEPTEAEQKALAEAEQLFLDNQKQYQQLNAQIVELQEELNGLNRSEELLNERLEVARKPIREEYERLWQRHQLLLAAIKLAFLMPLALLAGWLFVKWRHGTYAPLIYAFGIALAAKVLVVMHDHFPARYFKYLLILAALAVVLRVLIYLLRMIASPGRDYLLKQYREAYEHFFCPICAFPIRRGPLKYVFWTRRSVKKLLFPPAELASSDEPYVCPACGAKLFEKCESCGHTRHSLLPVCTDCGSEKSLSLESAPAEPPPEE